MSALQHLQKGDSIIQSIIDTIPAPNFTSTRQVYHDLMSCTIEQQIHYRSTKKIFQKMLDSTNISILTPDNFPQFEEKAFESVKLSTRKYETILNINQFWSREEPNWLELSDDEVRSELNQIKGVGKWTMDMILIFTLGRPDVFAYDDFHIKQIMTSLYQLNPKSRLKSQMTQITDQWSPYRSLAFLYLLDWKKYMKSNANRPK